MGCKDIWIRMAQNRVQRCPFENVYMNFYVPVTVHREQSVKREKTNRMQLSDVY